MRQPCRFQPQAQPFLSILRQCNTVNPGSEPLSSLKARRRKFSPSAAELATCNNRRSIYCNGISASQEPQYNTYPWPDFDAPYTHPRSTFLQQWPSELSYRSCFHHWLSRQHATSQTATLPTAPLLHAWILAQACNQLAARLKTPARRPVSAQAGTVTFTEVDVPPRIGRPIVVLRYAPAVSQ